MNVHTTAFSCPDCDLPLTGQGAVCDCAGFPSQEFLLEDEARFAPVEEKPTIVRADADSQPDMDLTVVRARPQGSTAFAKMADVSFMAHVAPARQPSASWRIVSGFLRSAALVAIAAFVGGLTVYFLQPAGGAGPASSQTPRETTPKAVTDISSSGPFINRAHQDAPLIPEEPPKTAAAPDIRTPERRLLADVGRMRNQPGETTVKPDSSSAAEQPESKVGAYVAENPAARRPTARCADGTYSFAASKAEACVGRGGVSDPATAARVPVRNAAYVLGPRGGCYYLDASGKKNYVEKKYCN